MIRNVLFDLGGVLIDLDIKRSLSAFNAMLLPDEAKADTSLQRHSVSDIDLLGGGESPLISLYQKGDISTEDFISALLSACVQGTTRHQIVDACCCLNGIADCPKCSCQILLFIDDDELRFRFLKYPIPRG